MARQQFSNGLVRSLSVTLLLAGPGFAVPSMESWLGLRGTQIQQKIILEGGLLTQGEWTGSAWTNDDLLNGDTGIYYQINLNESFSTRNGSQFDYLISMQDKTDSQDPNYVFGGIFNDPYQWYTFGGLADRAPTGKSTVTTSRVYPATPGNTDFTETSTQDIAVSMAGMDYVAAGAYASAPDDALGWWLSGMASSNRTALTYQSYGGDNSGAPTVTDSVFIAVDMATPNKPTFSYLPYPNDLIVPRAEGALVWLPYGNKGVLVAIGGVEVPGDLWLNVPPRDVPGDNSFMHELPIYDIDSGTWSMQVTQEDSGDRPTQLAGFCTATVPTANGEGYEIFVYGGYDGTYVSNDPSPRDEVWMLSVPAFEWRKVYESGPGAPHGRQGSYCVAPNPSTLITIGGGRELGSPLAEDSGIDVLDLNTMTWTGQYDASSDAELALPQPIWSSLGWADAKGPAAGTVTGLNNSNGDLNSIFSNKYAAQTTYYPYSSATPTSSPSNGGSGGNDNKWKIPLIAVLCSVIPVLIIAIIVFCCIKKRRKNKEGVKRTKESRRNVFSWLTGKDSHIDPPPEVTDMSDDTAVNSQQEYFPKSPVPQIHEAPPSHATSPGWQEYGYARSPGLSAQNASSTNEPQELMSQAGRDEMSLRNHPYYPRSLSGNHIMSVRSDTISHGSEAMGPSRHYGQISPYEMAHDKSNDDLAAPPTDVKLGEPHAEANKNASSHSLGLGAEHVSSPTAVTPTSAVASKAPTAPVSEESDRPTHQRNQSSISSHLPILPSPTVEEDRRRSRKIDSLPDVPAPSEGQQAKKSIYQENFDRNMGQQ